MLVRARARPASPLLCPTILLDGGCARAFIFISSCVLLPVRRRPDGGSGGGGGGGVRRRSERAVRVVSYAEPGDAVVGVREVEGDGEEEDDESVDALPAATLAPRECAVGAPE